MRYIGISIIAYIASVIYLYAMPSIQAQVDWERSKVQVYGKLSTNYNYLDYAKRTFYIEEAKETLRLYLSQLIHEIPYDENTNLHELLLRNNLFLTEYTQFLDNIQPAKIKFMDNHIHILLNISLQHKHSFMEIMPISWGKNTYRDLDPKDYVGNGYLSNKARKTFLPTRIGTIYTGLVVDMRNTPFRPSIAPKIFTQNGWLFYGASYLDREIGIKYGVVMYTSDLEASHIVSRVGISPLYVSAFSVMGKNQNNVVIAEEDAYNLLRHEETIQNLLQAKVILIINESIQNFSKINAQ